MSFRRLVRLSYQDTTPSYTPFRQRKKRRLPKETAPLASRADYAVCMRLSASMFAWFSTIARISGTCPMIIEAAGWTA